MPLLVMALSLVAFAGPKKDKKTEEPEVEDVEGRRGTSDPARRLVDVAQGRLDRVSLCRELVPKAARLEARTRATLEEACPSFFPIPAPPTFCRIDPCVTDVLVDAGVDRKADASP